MWVLVDAGLLQGQRASWTPHVPREVLMRSGAEWSKEAVVVSGRVITAGNFQNAREFAQKLLNLLASGG
jgi:putative intracellular protease/amidase